MSKRIYLILLALFVIIGGLTSTVDAQDGNGHVIIFVLDSVTFKDIIDTETPNIDELVSRGAIGLMNTTTAGGSRKTAAHITIGAGARATGGDDREPVLEVDEKWEGTQAEEVYLRRQGTLTEGKIVHLGFVEIQINNRTIAATVVPGTLGQALKDAGYRGALLGNADQPGVNNRPAAGIIMDTRGNIDDGFIRSDILESALKAPFGLQTDISALLKSYIEVKDTSDVIVIEWGDTARADLYNRFSTPQISSLYRQRAIERADFFIGELVKDIDFEEDLLLLITPSTSTEGYVSGDRLTPAILAGKGITTGLISSPTTRRQGLIANIDLAPTILNYFQISKPAAITGRAIQVTYGGSPWEYLHDLHQVSLYNFHQRPVIIKAYIFFIILLLSATAFAIYWPLPAKRLRNTKKTGLFSDLLFILWDKLK
jgi:hypothetical protein